MVLSPAIKPPRRRPTCMVSRHRLLIASILLLLPVPLAAAPTKTEDRPPAPPPKQPDRAVTVPVKRPLPARALSILHRPGMIRLAPAMVVKKPVQKKAVKRPRRAPRRHVGWGAGEQMTFSIKIAGVEAGRVALSVGRARVHNGARRVSIRGAGETIPFFSTFHRMKEEIITLIDLAGVLPIKSTATREAPKKDRKLLSNFVDGKHLFQKIERPNRKSYQRRRIIAGPRFDPVSTLYALRSIPLRKGARLTLRMLSGTTLYRLELMVERRERIYTRLGPRDTFRIGGVAQRITDRGRVIKQKPPRSVRMWVSADGSRVPVRLIGDTKLGVIEAHITSYRPPRRGLAVERPAI